MAPLSASPVKTKAFPVIPVAVGAGAILLLAVMLAVAHKYRKKMLTEQPKQP